MRTRTSRAEPVVCRHGLGWEVINYGKGPAQWMCETCRAEAALRAQQAADLPPEQRKLLNRGGS